MKTIILFAKPHCPKCDKLQELLLRYQAMHPDTIEVVTHDLSTEDGLTMFCRTAINPNGLPALLIGDNPEDWLDAHEQDTANTRRTYPYAGLHSAGLPITLKSLADLVEDYSVSTPACTGDACRL